MSQTSRDARLVGIRTQRLARLGALLAGFAHEVRNPLSTIGLNLQLVAEDFAAAETPRDKRTQKRLGTVQNEVKRLQTILDEFLSFARAPEPKLAAVDLNEKLRVLVEFHEPELKEAGISLRFFPGAGVGEVLVDWDHFQAAVVNLIRNAREAMPAGGEVMVSTQAEPGAVTIRVTDTGAGIPSEFHGRVFEPYFSTKKTGTGLGLPTVRRVVEEHGGTLSFQSEVGKGTQFSIRLPVHAGGEEVESGS